VDLGGDAEFCGHGEECLDGLLGAVVDFESEEFAEVFLGEVDGPACGGGVVGDDPVDSGLVFEHGALEDVGGGDDACFGFWIEDAGLLAHPGGVDEGEVCEIVPGLSEVYLMRV